MSENTFLKGRILPPLVKFALPLMLSQLLQALYGAVDLIVVGQYSTTADFSAVATGSQLMQGITGIIIGLTTGVTVLIGQAMGAGDSELAGKISAGMTKLLAAVSVIFFAVLMLFAPQALDLLEIPAAAKTAGVEYVRICTAGIFFISAYNAISGLFRGVGDSKMPLIFILIACIFNIIGDLILVAVFDMGAAGAAIADIHARGKLPIVCGGTGLYISSLVKNVQFDDTGADPELRRELENFAQEHGKHALWERLNTIDPEAAAQIHENNLVRVVRAIEIYEKTGLTLTQQKVNSLRQGSPYNACVIQIGFRDRAELYERIDRRVDEMMENGMLEEARRVYETSDPATAHQAIGYKELIPYLKGEAELADCVEKIKLETRHYAKRQLTWFRRMDNVTTVYAEKSEEYKIFFENVQKSIAKSEIMCYNKE